MGARDPWHRVGMRLSIAIVTALAAPAAAEPKLAGNVLVWVDAPLYPDAAATGPSIHIGQLEHGRDADAGHVVPMHVLGTQGDVVEVEPTADIECAWWRIARPPALASLHLFVKRADLAPVIVKPFAASFKNGSRIALQPGVAVAGGKDAFHDHLVPVAVPEAYLGVAYAPHAISPIAKPGKHTMLLDEKTDVALGDATFAFGPWVAATAERRGERVLFPVAARCMTAVVSAPKDRVHADVTLGNLYGVNEPATTHAKATGHVLPAGTALTSEAGDHVVATTSADVDVAKPTGARACADFVLVEDEPIAEAPHMNEASRPDRTLRLCAPAAAVR